MSIRKTIKPLFIGGIALTLALGLFVDGLSQNKRPRYNQRPTNSQSITIPADTIISMRINNRLSSKTSRVGDRFTATVIVPVYADGRVAIPAGAVVEGRIVQVTPAKRMSKAGTIAIDFDSLIFPNGSRVNLVGGLTSDDPVMREQIDEEGRVSGEKDDRTAVFVGGGGAIGAILGGIAGGGKGAVIGGVAGAGAGVAHVLLSKGEEAEVPEGTRFGLQLKQPIVATDSFVAESDPVPNYPDDPIRVGSSSPPDTERRPDVSGSESVPDENISDEPNEEPSDAESFPLPLSSPEMVRRAQVALRDHGYYEGDIDGMMGPRISDALRTYQRENNLPETGDLDPATANSLGINSAGKSSSRRPEKTSVEGVVLANVLSVKASRNSDGSINVLIDTQANTGGWRWFGEHVVNGDTLEVYARAVRPAGMVTQVLTRGRIELNVREGVEYVRRVVVHGSGGDRVVSLSSASTPVSSPDDRPSPSRRDPVNSSGSRNSVGGMSLQRQAEELLAECQRILGVRMTGTGGELESRSRLEEPDIELLFSIDSFANSAQLYSKLLATITDSGGRREATLALARQARKTDAVFTTTTSRAADSLAIRWDAIRQDILKLMQTYRISSSELDQ